jgi:hypothetical protein
MQIEPIAVPEPTYNHPIELAMLRQLERRGPALVAQYIAANLNHDVYFVGRDSAKRVFKEYRENPTATNRFADAVASSIADAARRTLLRQPISGGRDRFLILTGAPASGKTGSAGPIADRKIGIQLETIFTSLSRASELIQQALETGRVPIVRLFYTDDPRINVQRMIERATRIGRTVPLQDMARMYIEVPAIVRELKFNFGERLQLYITNNSETPDQALNHNRIERALYHVNRYTLNTALEAMHAELDKIEEGSHPLAASILEEARFHRKERSIP